MSKIYIVGDTHGELEIKKLSKKNWLRQMPNYPTRHDVVIIAGDFGLVFNNVQTAAEKWWLNWLTEKPFTTLFVDGNHENHNKLAELEIVYRFGNKVGKVNDKVFHLRRGEIYTIADKKIFVMGGAMSVDKEQRIMGVSWWEKELPNWEEQDRALQNLDNHGNWVDYIITHTCPSVVADIYIASGRAAPYGKLDDPTGKFFDYMIETIDFKRWYFGHWHDDWRYGKYQMVYNNIVEVE